MPWEQPYACGACGDKTLRIEARADLRWHVSCGNGHELAPMPTTIIKVGPKEIVET